MKILSWIMLIVGLACFASGVGVTVAYYVGDQAEAMVGAFVGLYCAAVALICLATLFFYLSDKKEQGAPKEPKLPH